MTTEQIDFTLRTLGSAILTVPDVDLPVATQFAIEAILMFGNDEIKQRIIPKLVTGEWQGSYCLSESSAGSDVA